MKKQKNKLDEMQEQKLLKIEHNACWLAFFGLLITIIAQVFIYDTGAEDKIIGEWIVFMCMSVYIVADCFRNGIWDRKASPTPKTNAVYSIIAGVVCGIIRFIVSYRNYHALEGAVAAGVFIMVFAAVVCFASLSILSFYYLKKTDKIENEEERSSDNEREE